MSAHIIPPHLFEELFFRSLKQEFPFVHGHVSEAITGYWWDLYVYAPAGVPSDDFHSAMEMAESILLELWHQKPCIEPEQVRFGRDSERSHFYNVWLPVAPHRTAEHFERTFSNTKPS